MNNGDSDSAIFIRELLDECQRQFVDERSSPDRPQPANTAGSPTTTAGGVAPATKTSHHHHQQRGFRAELPSYDEATSPPAYEHAVTGGVERAGNSARKQHVRGSAK
jgi:hypothetical protein